jgi:hypothetical protein
MELDFAFALLGAHGISTHRLPHANEIKIPEDVLKRIAEATDVAAAQNPAMVQSIHWALNSVLGDWLTFQSIRAMESSGHSIRPVLRAARGLLVALRNLDENARIALQAQVDAFQDAKKGDEFYDMPIETQSKGNTTVEEYEDMAGDLMAAANKAVGFQLMKPVKEAAIKAGKPRRGGAPKGHRHHELYLLVFRLRVAIEEVGKGRLTYDRITGGSLLKVLEELRPYTKFIPRRLPMRALEEMTRRKTGQKK